MPTLSGQTIYGNAGVATVQHTDGKVIITTPTGFVQNNTTDFGARLLPKYVEDLLAGGGTTQSDIPTVGQLYPRGTGVQID